MAPPISYYNSPWGRRNSSFYDASSHSNTARSSLSYAPARRSESPAQSRSPAPQRGSISDLPSTRIQGYGQVLKAASEQGFPPPTRKSVSEYVERALPPTPTSTVSADEMSLRSSGRKSSAVSSVPTPTSLISAHEVLDEQGRVRAVFARGKRLLPPSPIKVVAARPSPPTLGQDTPAVAFGGRLYMLNSPSTLSSLSTVNSLVDADGYGDVDVGVGDMPASPAGQLRMRKRAHWTLGWLEWYRED